MNRTQLTICVVITLFWSLLVALAGGSAALVIGLGSFIFVGSLIVFSWAIAAAPKKYDPPGEE